MIVERYIALVTTIQRFVAAIVSIIRYNAAVTTIQRYEVRLDELDTAAFKIKSINDVDTTFEIDYDGPDVPIWTDGTQQLTGTSVTFNWTTATEKEIKVYCDPLKVTKLYPLHSGATFNGVTYLNIKKLNLLAGPLDLNTYSPMAENKLSHVFFPDAGVLDSITMIGTDIRVINLVRTKLDGISVNFGRSEQVYRFTQPKADWSCTNFTLTDSLAVDTLALSGGTITDTLNIHNNVFLETVSLNKAVSWANTSINIKTCPILEYVDLSNMISLLSASGTTLNLSGIGATKSDVDDMLDDLDSTIITGLGTVYLNSNTAPSQSGDISKASLESKGITVIVDP